mmetsp:Transcript_7301/g.8689  ORF Transcript_7301/g.8689 Transcript_7301/m.8689 type:complete len:92 (+) Transcript_7301:1856-2131(+)
MLSNPPNHQKRYSVRANAKILLSENENDLCQKWKFTNTGQLINVLTGYVLTVKNGSKKPFSDIWVREANHSKAQMWYFEKEPKPPPPPPKK